MAGRLHQARRRIPHRNCFYVFTKWPGKGKPAGVAPPVGAFRHLTGALCMIEVSGPYVGDKRLN